MIELSTHDDGLATSRPPDHYEPVTEWRLHTVEELASFRADLARSLEQLGFPAGPMGDVPSKLLLIASELATNALRHGRPPTIVQLLRDGESFLLQVTDHDPDVAPVYAGKRVVGAGGLGLHMARVLSVEVGWYATPTDKTVWAIFDAAGGAASPR
ncbi:ATP-binding protein [Cellulomonas xylanilytica]|uniref:Histidine kinase n=1 Tax=Cellulomonas xylanilytica TaxID=233583 RepID=A0A510V9G5_9CELL|nr:ATP-binding protein [Cellulomonas xylanilytica]GEK23507.1 histidine kinase [Cellulomonas xylanilytica]